MDMVDGPVEFCSKECLLNICTVLFLLVFILATITFYLWQERNSPSVPEAYADCMVDTYLYGYLNKIIPDNGSGEGSLKDKLLEYRITHELSYEQFPFNKLFVIIPASGHIKSILDNSDPGRIELRQDLPPKKMDRAGVKNRTYKSSLYKIKFRGMKKSFTVAMEGAPPLLCLYDSCKENSYLKEYKHELIHMFYKKLKAKLEEKIEFEGACELVYFDDLKGNKSLADELINRYLDGTNSNMVLNYD